MTTLIGSSKSTKNLVGCNGVVLIGFVLSACFTPAKGWSAQQTPNPDDVTKQPGLIEDAIAPDNPMPGSNAVETIRVLATNRDMYRLDLSYNHPGLQKYDYVQSPRPISRKPAVVIAGPYFVLGKGSPFYPSVLKTTIVLWPDHGEVHRTIQCDATDDQCALLRKKFGLIDKRCGAGVKGCPDYDPKKAKDWKMPPAPPGWKPGE